MRYGIPRTLTSLVLATAVAASAPAAGARPARAEQPQGVGPVDAATLQRALDAGRVRFGLPTVQAAVVRGHRLVWSGAAGPAAAGSRYVLASSSKTITAAMVLRLVDRGRVQLDRTAADYGVVLGGGPSPTLRQLLSHTAGLGDHEADPAYRSASRHAQRRWRTAEVLRMIGRRSRRFAPGTGWHYANSDYVVLGAVVARVCGCSLERALQRLVAGPLRLRSLSFRRSVPGHPLVGSPPTWALGTPWADGGMAASAADVARGVDAILSTGFLRPATRRAMLRPATPLAADGSGYGLGVDLVRQPGLDLAGHPGASRAGYMSAAAWWRQGGTTVVVLTDALTPGEPTEHIAADLRRALGEPF